MIRYDWAESNVTLSTQNTEIGMAKEDVAVEFKGTPFHNLLQWSLHL